MTRTKKIGIAALIMSVLSIILNVGPVVTYSVIALSENNSETQKCVLLSMISISVILSAVCLLNKYTLRSKIWLILIGLYICMDKVLGCVLILAITQVFDELVVAPLKKHFRRKYQINKEIDKRMT